MRRKLLVLYCVVLASLPTAAYAHYIYDGHFVWDGPRHCAWVTAEISHGPTGGGYAKTILDSMIRGDFDDPVCNQGYARSSGRMAARNVLVKWHEQAGRAVVCVDGSWNFNSYTRPVLTKKSVYEIPCAPGYYTNIGGGYVLHNNKWKGGYHGVGYPHWHYLPQ